MSTSQNSKGSSFPWAAILILLALVAFPLMLIQPAEDSQTNFYLHMQNESARVEFALHDVRDYERWIKSDEQKFVDAQGQTIPVSKWPAEDRQKHEELRSLLLKAKARYNSFAYEYNQLMEREEFKFTTIDSLPQGKKRILPRKFDPLPTHE